MFASRATRPGHFHVQRFGSRVATAIKYRGTVSAATGWPNANERWVDHASNSGDSPARRLREKRALLPDRPEALP